MPQELRKRHKGHARSLKHLEERFEWYADAIEMEPASCKGRWREAHFPAAREVRLDLGCGKGQYTVAAALAEPEVLFVGLDYEKRCIALAAEAAVKSGAKNVIFTLADAEDIADLFGAGELSDIYLNFSTPHPRKKHARERLTYVDNLLSYRPLLAEKGAIHFKTDSPMFFEFSLAQFQMAAFDVVWQSTDLEADRPDIELTEYEEKLTARGAKIHACRAVKAERPISHEQQVPLSLFEYLPDDLDSMEYIPYGMEGGVENFRNRRAKERASALHPAE